MKKLFVVLGGIVFIGSQLTGCFRLQSSENDTEQQPDTQTIKLVWQSDQDFQEHEDYFNQVLKEKNLLYEVDFITYENEMGNQTADLKELQQTWVDTYDATEDILAGEFIALDEYLDTEEGNVIKASLPENVWDTYKVDGKQYTVLSTGFIPSIIVYIWDTELAEKYDVHPEEWNEKIWEYEEELQKVSNGEKDAGSFVTVENLRIYASYLKGITQPLGICYPFAIKETDEMPEAVLLNEMPEYREYLNGVQRLYELGIYDPDAEENSVQNISSFLKIDVDFKTKDAYLAWQEENFWDTHEIKEIWQKPLWRFSLCAKEVGISAESKQQKEAFSFLCSLYRDADLTNALMWGEEGINYEIRGNAAVKPLEGGYIPALYAGNNFIAYTEVGQDENKKEIYPAMLAECEKSKINGFEFSGKECKEKLQNIYQIWNEWDLKSGKSILEENETIIRQYKEAGADDVIAEWNRQYREWQKEQ